MRSTGLPEKPNDMVSLPQLEETPTDSEKTLIANEKTLTGSEESLASNDYIETNELLTHSVRSPGNPEHSTTCVAWFNVTNNTSPPALLLGLHMLDLDLVRVASKVRSIADNSARIELCSLEGSIHWASGCNWLKIPAGDPDIEYGSYDTTTDAEWSTSQQQTSRRISFRRTYPYPPHVTVWLSMINAAPSAACRVAVTARDVSADGFTLHLETWGDSKLTGAAVTWLACPVYRRDIHSGTFSTDDVRPSTDPRRETAGRVAFWGARFTRPPRVFVALNRLEMAHTNNARLHVRAENVTATGMDWRVEGWYDTLIHQVGVSFLAIADT